MSRRKRALFDAGRKQRWTGSRALVPVDRDRCPACDAELRDETVDQLPLLRHGGHGAAERSTTRACRCGWRLLAETGEVRP